MALAQTNDVAARLLAAAPETSPEVSPFKPMGDVDQVSKLGRHGGKGGAFVAEIRAALRAGDLQAAMHSLKDVPGDEEAPGLIFGAHLPRESVADALVLKDGLSLDAFERDGAAGFKIGTNAVRRAAYLKRLYPNAEIIHYRGAADTRIRKLNEGAMQRLPDGGEVGPADALIMAESGLGRVGLSEHIARTFSPSEMLPAVGQGIVVVECVADDFETRRRLAAIDDKDARCAADAEREMLWILNGHCNAPIAGHAVIDGQRLRLDGAVLSLDGGSIVEASAEGEAAFPRAIGREVGLKLIAKGAAEIIASAEAAG